jgi:hypothetical protein
MIIQKTLMTGVSIHSHLNPTGFQAMDNTKVVVFSRKKKSFDLRTVCFLKHIL